MCNKSEPNLLKYHHTRGIALVEVLLAALVLAIGSAAFLKLQSISLKNSNNNQSRTQATEITVSFVEQLRSNRGFISLSPTLKTGYILGGTVDISSSPAPQSNSNCQSSNPGADCVQATLNYQRYLTSEKMHSNFPKDMSLLCYQENTSGALRLTFLWRDNLSEDENKDKLTASDCPSQFSSQTNNTDRDNSVTIYAQL